jgi:hypothetical protein
LNWLAPLIAVMSSGFSCAFGVAYGTFAAADTDPYGYVSQADLIANGSLRLQLDAFRSMPWRDAVSSFIPPGYTLSPDGSYAVPVYSIGLPLLMGVAQRLLGDRVVIFYVVPLLGAFAVWMTYRLGREIGNSLTGAMAAVLVATSPALLYQVTQPVSDVPAMALWTASLAFAIRPTPKSALAAGLAASMAILIRPNLVPLSAVIGCFLLLDSMLANGPNGKNIRPVVLFSAGLVPGCAAVALINAYLHGSPFRSGYGPLDVMFGVEHILPNLDRYPRWLLTSQTPFIYLGVLAPVVLPTRRVWMLLAFCSILFLMTVSYYPFGRDDQVYLRFLLPLYPPLLVLSVVVLRASLRRAQPNAVIRVGGATLCVAAVAVWQLSRAEGAFVVHLVEQRYVTVGRYVRDVLPANAVYIAELHSGTIRYYSQRLTINGERLDGDSLDLAIETMTRMGRPPFIVLEEGERPQFTRRFANQEFGKLDWPPRHRTFDGVVVNIWDPGDRESFVSGTIVPTYDIGMRKPPLVLTMPPTSRP